MPLMPLLILPEVEKPWGWRPSSIASRLLTFIVFAISTLSCHEVVSGNATVAVAVVVTFAVTAGVTAGVTAETVATVRESFFGASFYNGSGSLARATPLFLFGLELSCCVIFWLQYMKPPWNGYSAPNRSSIVFFMDVRSHSGR